MKPSTILVLLVQLSLVVFWTNAKTNGNSGPKPFRKPSSSPTSVILIDTLNTSKNKTKGLFINNISDDQRNLFNQSIDLFPPSVNETTLDQSDKNTPLTILEQPSPSKKPSGTLYVDSVHNMPRLGNTLRMAGTPSCNMPPEEQDPHKLSSSHFGFPRSIVNKALEDSPFRHVLNMMAKQQYYNNEYKQPDMSIKDKKVPSIGLKQGTDQLSNPLAQTGFSNFVGQPYKSRAGDVGSYKSSPSLYKPEVIERSRIKNIDGGINNVKSPFGNFESNLNLYKENNRDMDQFAPQLLDGSLFGSVTQSNTGNEKPTSLETENEVNTTSSSPGAKTGRDDEMGDGKSNNNLYEGNRFNKNLPDVSGDDVWLPSTNVHDFNDFNDWNSNIKTSSGKENKFSGIIDNLFPPKKSDNLPEVSGLKDLIPNKNPVFKYSNDKKSNVGSPFEFNIKSLFGSIPSSNVGPGINKVGSMSAVSPSSNNFGFFAKNKPLGSGGIENGARLTNHNNIRFLGLRRRKRQAGSEQTTRVSDTCKASYSVLHQYRNHDGACFVVLPDVQGIHFATCPNTSCAGCRVNGGTSRCSAVKAPTWIWAYCETGPNAGKVMPHRLMVPVACTCKVAYCQRIPLGSS